MCARHIYGNLKKKWSGLSMKNLFWGAASACLESVFDHKMQLITNMDKEAHKWLVDHDPNSWCRAFFETDRACPAFENGVSESYHSAILFARGKPIITMLEDIRVYLMQRLVAMAEKARDLDDVITPSIRKQIEIMKKFQRHWVVYPSGFKEFEVRKMDESYGVHLEKKECTCRWWNLSGIPCVHVVAAYCFVHQDPASGVSTWYSKGYWQEAYAYNIKPVGGPSMWPKSILEPPLPPVIRRMPGRPKKKRRKDATEDVNKITKRGSVMTCQKCYQKGHNKRGCTNEAREPPPKEKRTAGRKRAGGSKFGEAKAALKRMADGGTKNHGPNEISTQQSNWNEGSSQVTQEGGSQVPKRQGKRHEGSSQVTQEDVGHVPKSQGKRHMVIKKRTPSERIKKMKFSKPFPFDKDGTGASFEKPFELGNDD